jgi:hypothetical protein
MDIFEDSQALAPRRLYQRDCLFQWTDESKRIHVCADNKNHTVKHECFCGAQKELDVESS